MDNEDFTIPFITDTTPKPLAGHQLSSQAKRNVCIIAINEEEPSTSQGALDELNHHQTPHGKSKVKISIRRMKIYQITYLE